MRAANDYIAVDIVITFRREPMAEYYRSVFIDYIN